MKAVWRPVEPVAFSIPTVAELSVPVTVLYWNVAAPLRERMIWKVSTEAGSL